MISWRYRTRRLFTTYQLILHEHSHNRTLCYCQRTFVTSERWATSTASTCFCRGAHLWRHRHATARCLTTLALPGVSSPPWPGSPRDSCRTPSPRISARNAGLPRTPPCVTPPFHQRLTPTRRHHTALLLSDSANLPGERNRTRLRGGRWRNGCAMAGYHVATALISSRTCQRRQT